MFRCILLLCASSTLFAADEWVRLKAPNFNVYTNAGPREAKRTAERLEQIRDFFMKTKSSDMTTRLPVTVVAFKNRKDYKPYSPSEQTAAFYVPSETQDTIVMGGTGVEFFPVAIHEYMHLLIRHTGIKVPVWLNEGIAEVYSTAHTVGNKIVLGTIPEGRVYPLYREKLFPLEKLFAIGHDSPEYNEGDRKGMLYAQSWLLTHMLFLSPAYSPKVAQFLEAVHKSGSSENAFLSVYGKSLADVTKDQNTYLASNAIGYAETDLKFEKFQMAEPEPTAGDDLELVLINIVSSLRRYDEAEQRLAALSARATGSAPVAEALGELHWRKGDLAKAAEQFGRAVDLGTPNWKTYWHYATMSQRSGDKRVLTALEKLLELNPSHDEGRTMLGMQLYRESRFKESLQTLSKVKTIPSERAYGFFMTMANAAFQAKDLPNAKIAANRARGYTKDPSEIVQLDRFLKYVDYTENPNSASFRNTKPSLDDETEPEPDAAQASAPKHTTFTESAKQEILIKVVGVLQTLDCSDTTGTMKILSEGRRVALLIRDPGAVYIKGAEGSEQTLTCGPSNKPVVVEYKPNIDKASGTIGDVRSIQFTGLKTR